MSDISIATTFNGLNTSSKEVFCTITECDYPEALRQAKDRKIDGRNVVLTFEDKSILTIKTK